MTAAEPYVVGGRMKQGAGGSCSRVIIPHHAWCAAGAKLCQVTAAVIEWTSDSGHMGSGDGNQE